MITKREVLYSESFYIIEETAAYTNCGWFVQSTKFIACANNKRTPARAESVWKSGRVGLVKYVDL